MLYLYYNKKRIAKHLVTDIDKAFEKREDMWFYSKFTADVCKRIDQVELLPPKKIVSPLFGESDVTFLSKYAKLFVLMYEQPNAVYRLSDVHPELGDTIYSLSNGRDLHILVDGYFNYNEEQQAYLPEYEVTLTGPSELRSAYNNYIRNRNVSRR